MKNTTDGFRTQTNAELNEYTERLRKHVIELEDRKERWFHVGKGWILTEERNRLHNPRGSYKWHGWETEAREYRITVFPAENIEIRDEKVKVIGLAQEVKVIENDRNAANEYFVKVAKPMAEGLGKLVEE